MWLEIPECLFLKHNKQQLFTITIILNGLIERYCLFGSLLTEQMTLADEVLNLKWRISIYSKVSVDRIRRYCYGFISWMFIEWKKKLLCWYFCVPTCKYGVFQGKSYLRNTLVLGPVSLGYLTEICNNSTELNVEPSRHDFWIFLIDLMTCVCRILEKW